MTITVQDIERLIQGTIKYMPDHLSAAEVANEAGEMLVNMRAWNWLRDQSTTLDFTANEGFVDLPDDVRDIIFLEMSNSRTQSIWPATYRQIIELRNANIGQPQDYVFCISQVQAAGAPTPRIELFPTPTANVDDVLTLIYHAGWTTVSVDTVSLSLPTYMEGVYKSLVRAVVRGVVEEDKAELAGDFTGIQRRLDMIEKGPEMRWAKRRDTEIHRSRGPLRNGIGEAEWPTWFWDRTITGPSP